VYSIACSPYLVMISLMRSDNGLGDIFCQRADVG
jgi:hypothetical protein